MNFSKVEKTEESHDALTILIATADKYLIPFYKYFSSSQYRMLIGN